MAVSTSSRFGNGMVGIPQAGANVDIYSSSSSARWAVGTHFYREDGNVYVYSHFGYACTPGYVCAQDISQSSNTELANVMTSAASAVAVAGETIKPGAVGSKYIQLTLASITANQFAGGYIVLTAGTGSGYTYRIKGNTATDDPASGFIRIELDKCVLQAAIDNTTDCIIVGNRYANLTHASATDVFGAGIACAYQQAGYYGWVQKSGVVGVLQDTVGTKALGYVSKMSGTTDGTLGVATAAAATDVGKTPVVGFIIVTGTASTLAAVNVNF